MRRPDYTQQFKAKAADYINNGKYKEALYYLKKLDPDTGVQTLKSSCYIATKRYNKAEKILKRIVKKKPRDYEILRNLVAVSFYKGKYNKEVFYLEKLLEAVNNKKNLDNISEMTAYHGIEYYLKGEKEKAEKLFDLSLQANPKNEICLYNRYILAEEKDDFQTAAGFLKTLLKFNKKHVDANIALGGVYFKQKTYKKSIKAFKNALKYVKEKDGKTRVITLIGKAYFNDKEYKEAEKWFTKSWELKKDDPDKIGLILLTWRKLYEEEKEVKYAINILEFLLLRGETAEAKKFLEGALEEFPGNKKLKNYNEALKANESGK